MVIKEKIKILAKKMKIRLLSEDISDLDDRVEVLRHKIGGAYAASANRSSNGSS